MTDLWTTGVILGISAGMSPGPILTLVITETLKHGVRSGVKVAMAPIVTDAPIIVLTLLLLAKLSRFGSILGCISIAGGLFLLFMAYESLWVKKLEPVKGPDRPKSLVKGVLANLLNPNPYLFWVSVGGPIMAKSMSGGVMGPLLFIGGFYLSLVGSKVLLAVLVGRSRAVLESRGYEYAMRFLGLVLIGLALTLFRDGFKLLGIV
ncbi:MAG TPA: LysE family translocator [Syntrophobacteraceae bacterium]|nr:LysE family translocator [Syntrophobacteraceae bacterium]